MDVDPSIKEPPAKKALFGEEPDFLLQYRTHRQKEEKTDLQKSLEYLHNILQRLALTGFNLNENAGALHGIGTSYTTRQMEFAGYFN